MSVIQRIFRSMELGHGKLSSVITEMSVAEKRTAAEFFHREKIWPAELDNGAITDGDFDQTLLEYLIDTHPPALENPATLLSYLDTSSKFEAFCEKWISDSASIVNSNPDARDELFSFISTLQDHPRSNKDPKIIKLLEKARAVYDGVAASPSPSVSSRQMSGDELWDILGEKTQKLLFVKAVAVLERESSELSASSSTCASPIHMRRSSTPITYMQDARFALPPPSKNISRQTSQSSPRLLTPRGVPSPNTVPTERPQLLSLGVEMVNEEGDVEEKTLAVGKSLDIFGWVVDITDSTDMKKAPFIGKLVDTAANKVFIGNHVNKVDLLERIVPFSPEEVARLRRTGRVHVPYVHIPSSGPS